MVYRVLLLILASGCASAPVGAQTASDDAAIGVWPWLVGNIDADIPTIVQTASGAGLDTIYIHLWRTTGVEAGTLHMVDETGTFPSSWGTIQSDVTLTSLIAQAHAAHLQVVGVVNCFLNGGPLPGYVAHETRLLQVVDHLLHTVDASGDPVYALDGIALDRVRYYSGTSNPHQVVTAFVQQVKDLCGLVPLHAFIPANLWHIDGPPYNGSFRTYAEAMGLLQGQYGHRWEDLASVLDVALPMAYVAESGLYGNNTGLMQSYLQTVASYHRLAEANAGVTVRLLPAVRAWTDAGQTTTAASLQACIQGASLGGADGFMTFRYYTALGQGSWWNAISAGANPGPAHPRAALAATSAAGGSITLDATASSSLAFGPSTLEARFDLDDDGTADTPWSTSRMWTFAAAGSSPFLVAVEVRDGAGHRSVRKRVVTPAAATLTLAGGFTSASLGSAHSLLLNAGPGAAGHVHVIAASATGTTPGTSLAPGVTVPLVWDAFTDLILLAANGPFLPGFIGNLDGTGWAVATMAIPPGALPAAWAGQNLWFAAAGLDPATGLFSFTSGAASLSVLP